MLQEVLKERPGVEIVKLHKSGGVVNRNSKYRQRSRVQKTRVRSISPSPGAVVNDGQSSPLSLLWSQLL